MSDGTRLKVAIIGAGVWGFQHARVLAARADVELCAIAGRTPAKTQARAAAFGARAYTDVRELLAVERPDLVTLSLPNQEHFEPTLEVIRAGIPLLVEKPLVFELDQADTLLREAEARRLFFAINFNHHYARPVAMAHRAVREGRLGDLVLATWRFGGEGGTSHPFNNLVETQCHAFDMLEFLCGPIDSVMAQMTDRTGSGYFRTLAIALHFRSGAVGSLVGTYDSSYAYPDTHLLELNGTAGRVLVEDTVRRYTFSAAGSETAETWQAGYFNDLHRSFYATFDLHMDAVLDALRSGRPPPVHASAGRRALQLAWAAVESFRGGKRLAVETASFREAEAPALGPPPPSP